MSEIEFKGFFLQGRAYKRLPKRYTVDGIPNKFLFFNALYVNNDEAAELAIQDGAMLAACLKHWGELAGLHGWITKYVQLGEADTGVQ